MIEDAIRSGLFDEIYNNYYKPVCNYINRMIMDRNLAEDLAQETLIKVMKGLKDADEDKNLSPWIFRIACNTCVDYYRKHRTEYELIDNILCFDSGSGSPEHILLNKERGQKIKKALSMLNRKHRTVLLLRACNGLSYREIADQLRLKESTVKTLIHRGRQQLQKVYAEVY